MRGNEVPVIKTERGGGRVTSLSIFSFGLASSRLGTVSTVGVGSELECSPSGYSFSVLWMTLRVGVRVGPWAVVRAIVPGLDNTFCTR